MKWKSGEIVIELAGEKNQYFWFPVLSMRLRGRWDSRHVRRESTKTELANLPVIPGQMIALDVKDRTLRVLDPLGFPENKAVLDEANRIIEPWFGRMRPHDTSVLRSLNPTEIKTTLWWMAQTLWSEKAELVNGTLPDNTVAGRKKILVEADGELKVRWFAPLTNRDGTLESPFATEEEIARMVAEEPAGSRMAVEPAGMGT